MASGFSAVVPGANQLASMVAGVTMGIGQSVELGIDLFNINYDPVDDVSGSWIATDPEGTFVNCNPSEGTETVFTPLMVGRYEVKYSTTVNGKQIEAFAIITVENGHADRLVPSGSNIQPTEDAYVLRMKVGQTATILVTPYQLVHGDLIMARQNCNIKFFNSGSNAAGVDVNGRDRDNVPFDRLFRITAYYAGETFFDINMYNGFLGEPGWPQGGYLIETGLSVIVEDPENGPEHAKIVISPPA